MTIETIILAAGQGTRMQSSMAKVLQPLAGKAMINYVIEAAQTVSKHIHLIVGHQAKQVQTQLQSLDVNFILQHQQLGTGHAVAQALPALQDDSTVLVLYGDVPFLRSETLKQITQIAATQDTLCLLTAFPDDSTGYGRIIRDKNQQVCAIIEHKDASDEQKQINEINSGILAVPARYLKLWLPKLSNQNSQGEYYLTDIVALAVNDGLTIHTVHPACIEETLGVNDRIQQAALERWYQRQQATHLMSNGVTCADPGRLDIRGEVKTGQDVFIDINNVFEGSVTLGNGVHIGPNCFIKNSVIADHVEIKANTVIEDAEIGPDSIVGPFARIRPGTQLSDGVHIGNFVEVKNSQINTGSKVNHLTYIGDADIGTHVNVGAGTITCNYDGANKFRTTIADAVFVGSNSTLVAPVELTEGSFIAAGSVITRKTEPGKLTIARTRQKTVEGWRKPVKQKDGK